MTEPRAAESLPEDHRFLWLVAASPTIWAAHFLVSYVMASVWCARFASRDEPLGGVLTAIFVLTALALAGILVVGWGAYGRYSHGKSHPPHDDDTPEDRHRFLGHATLLLSGLSAVATIFSAVAVAFFRTCQ